MPQAKPQPSLSAALLQIIQSGEAGTQQHLISMLSKQGLAANQSSISRALRKIGAVKSLNAKGEAIYRIPHTASQIGRNQTIRDLVTHITSNEQLILVHTCTGSANVVAQLIDEQDLPELLGTLAGDNTLMIVPKSIRLKSALEKKLADFFNLSL
ncbi:MAG: hypothetical protein EYC62_06805 [Alphaproteobacteria bacterium]|nr:MAG: hypothetical protein EYC62_06805 [Alphaproteobacteria bacterium]